MATCSATKRVKTLQLCSPGGKKLFLSGSAFMSPVNSADPEICRPEKEEAEDATSVSNVRPDSMFIFKPDNP